MDKYEKLNLVNEELEDIELAKAGFTRAEIEEMDRRAARIGQKPSYTTEEMMEMFKMKG